jgi:hypothetical protein
MASNELLYQSNKIWKEFKALNSTSNFEMIPEEDNFYFYGERIMNLAIGEIDRKRREVIEARGRRFYYSDGYTPRWNTKNRVRNFLISEIKNETISKSSVTSNGRVLGTEQHQQLQTRTQL